MTRRNRLRWQPGILAVLILVLASCGGAGAEQTSTTAGDGSVTTAGDTPVTTAGGTVVELTCQRCEESPSDVFSQAWYDVVQAFNAEFEGQYNITVENFGGQDENDLQYWERLALADALPDIFIAQSSILQTLAETGKLYDFGPALEAEAEWRDSFYPGVFDALTGPNGEVWGIPEQRDVVGIYWNTALFEQAGLNEFPETWDELLSAAQGLQSEGVIPFAMDGDWVTQLMWANLIGTQEGGTEFLTSGIRDGGFADNPIVVEATEFLKELHVAGLVNDDAFSGDYQTVIANGPWMVAADIQSDAATTDLYSRSAYALSPGWNAGERGVIVLGGNAGIASGSTDPAEQAAVVEFNKFATTTEVQLERTIKTGAYWPIQLDLSDEQRGQLEPITLELLEAADSATYEYPHAKFATLQPFTDEWLNQWPAYVQGAITTEEFLESLSDAVTG
ncbi:MAG: extracellular solute-binding protein [Actinobacteria bacterium]|nr:extracellular solute-binding protein [Actinomycetota bacterium]